MMEEIEEVGEVVEIIEVDRTEANAILARRHGEATYAGYESARKKFKIWMKRYYPRGGALTTRSVILPLHRDSTLAFSGQVQRLKFHGDVLEEIPHNEPPIAVSSMTFIGSALSDLYKTRNMPMADDLKQEIAKFMKGYTRTINILKQEVMYCVTVLVIDFYLISK